MKKIIIALILIAFFACEKIVEVPEKQKCWICTETTKAGGNVTNVKKTRVCDILEVTKLDGLRIIKGTTHITLITTECELED